MKRLYFFVFALIWSASFSTAQMTASEFIAQDSEKIVGGEPALANEFPWMIRLSRPPFSVYCGASLVNSSWVLTAAHCVAGAEAGDFEVIAGDHQVSVQESTEQRRAVRKIVPHPGYNSRTYSSDIALLELASPLALNRVVKQIGPALLPSTGTELVVIGWGRTAEGGSSSDVLRKVAVDVVDYDACSRALGTF